MIHSLGERRLETDGEDYYVAPGAQLIGAVRLRSWASVWFNAVLRADDNWIEVGAGSNVQDGTVIHVDGEQGTLIGREVTIGHMVMLHSCSIGDETLIGNGAIVLDHACIGSRCVIAAGTLIPPGKRIPDGSLVMGAPGRVVRACGAQELELIQRAARNYRQRASRYRQQLRPGRGGPE